VTRSHRNEDRGGERRWTFNGVEYPTRKLMCAARREEYVRLLDEEDMNFTQAAHGAGVSKRTGKVWRNGRTRATGRNEKASIDWYRSTMDKPKRIHARYFNQEERILIADRLRLGDSIRAIARLLGRDPSTVSREVERNRNPEFGDYEPYRAQQKAADRLKRPKPRKAADGTPVERTTRFTIPLRLPDGHDAEHVQQAIIDKMASLPKLLRNSLTWDQGAELALHKRIGASLDMAVYFCDPHSPWQRGTNENTNGLLRQYFPKGTDLSVYPEDYLDAVAEELNDRPRKALGFMKPSEKIIELLDDA